MPAFGPISRKDLIHYLKGLGFDGPYEGRKHEFLVRGKIRLVIPNPHRGDISRNLLSRVLQQAGVERKEWEKL